MGSYPHDFSLYPAGTFPAQDWMDNWQRSGLASLIYCAASGTNDITLTPATTAPLQGALSAYQQGMVLTFIAANNNSGPVSIRVGSLPALAGYNVAGVALVSGNIQAGTFYYAVYDSALNSGVGGFRVSPGAGITAGSGGMINIQAFGATCSDGSGPDNTTAIQSAINATPAGGTLYIPCCPGTAPHYVVTGSGAAIFTRSAPINIVGDGRTGSNISIAAGVPNTRDVFRMTPSTLLPPAFINGWSFRDFRIYQLGGPGAAAQDAIHFDVPLGNLALNVTLERMTIDSTANGASFRVTNDPATATGGVAYSQIVDCNLESIFLQTIGDGIKIMNNVIGALGARTTITASFVAGAGGFQLGPGNVLTSAQGPVINIVNGNGVVINQNYIETGLGTNSYGFLVDIGSGGTGMLSPQLTGNQFSVTAGHGNPTPVRIRTGVLNAHLADMRYIAQTTPHIQVDAGASDTVIDLSAMALVVNSVTPLSVTDNGTRTVYVPTVQRTVNFTPSLLFGGLAVGMGYSVQVGVATRILNLVNVRIQIILTAKGTSVGAATIAGLPFTSAEIAIGLMQGANLAAGSGTQLQCSINAGAAAIVLGRYAAPTALQLTDADFNNNSIVYIQLTYPI